MVLLFLKHCTLALRENVCNTFFPFVGSFSTRMPVVQQLSIYMESHVSSPG